MEIKVGTRAQFKKDIEGHGIVLETNWMGYLIIGSEGAQKGYQFHQEARWDSGYGQFVVAAHRDQVYSIWNAQTQRYELVD